MSRRPTGTVRATESGADLIITRSFRAQPDDVWKSVTTSELTKLWIGPWEGTAGPGKTVRLTITFEEGAPACDVLIVKCDAARHLVLSMKDAQGDWNLELKLEASGNSTELTFVQHLRDRKLAGDTGPGWEYYLDRLVAAREGQPMPQFEEYYPAQKQHYLA